MPDPVDVASLTASAVALLAAAWCARDTARHRRRAEGAVARIRALAERWRYTSDRKEGPLRELLASLDPFVEQPDDPFSHAAQQSTGRAGGLDIPSSPVTTSDGQPSTKE
ncbi:hypothetical protein ACFRKB_11295 [Streptomyces scopuliridis]|uniref:hypothetical protein n=1 Tax=Streptomyces scopuliridis TaxID=452529 RepID=UPI0036CBC9E5